MLLGFWVPVPLVRVLFQALYDELPTPTAVPGIAELLIFHPVDTVAKRLMSNKAKVLQL